MRPFSGDVCGWVFCAKSWQLAHHAIELRVLVGQPFERILKTAVQEHVALIVLGTHGRTGLAHLIMGSVAERVVRLAPCPVLTVKASPADAQAVVSPRPS